MSALVLVAGGCLHGDDRDTEFLPERAVARETDALAPLRTIPEIVERVAGAVVGVRAGSNTGGRPVASGVVWGTRGIVVSTADALGGAKTATVVTVDGRRFHGDVVGIDGVTRIAVIRVPRLRIVPAQVADDVPDLGEIAVAVGTPATRAPSVTAGIVAGFGQPDPAARSPELDVIQLDRPVSAPAAGGAVVDARGRVVGVLGRRDGFGYAVPAPIVTAVVNAVAAGSTFRHVYVGIRARPFVGEPARAVDAPAQGLVVDEVDPDSPAAAAAVAPGDVITRLDGDGVNSFGDYYAVLTRRRPGDVVRLVLARRGSIRIVEVRLSALE